MVVQSLGDYYTLQGAGKELGLSYGQVWRTIQEQQVPTLTLGRTLLVTLADLCQALAAPRSSVPARPALPAAPLTAPGFRVRAQVCPECGSTALAYEEGCRKCHACGWSAC